MHRFGLREDLLAVSQQPLYPTPKPSTTTTTATSVNPTSATTTATTTPAYPSHNLHNHNPSRAPLHDRFLSAIMMFNCVHHHACNTDLFNTIY